MAGMLDDQQSYRDALAHYLMSEKDTSPAPSQMDGLYNALRPHQRGLFNTIGAAAQGARGIYDSGVNALTTMHRILGYGDPVTMDEVQRGASDAAMFAMPGTMGRSRIAPRDEYMATKFGNSETSMTPAYLPHPDNRTAVAGNFESKKPAVSPFQNDPHLGVTAPVEHYARGIEFRNTWGGLREQIDELLRQTSNESTKPVQPPPFTSVQGGAGPLSPNEGYARAIRSQNAKTGDWAETSKTAELEKRLRYHGQIERDLASQPDFGRNGSYRVMQIEDLLDAERRRLADLLEKSYLRPVE